MVTYSELEELTKIRDAALNSVIDVSKYTTSFQHLILRKR